jgi:putative copper resistance protein D
LTAALIAVRFAHFASVMLLFGASAFLAVLAPPGLRAALQPSIGRIITGASFAAAATAVFWLQLQGGAFTEDWGEAIDPNLLSAVLFDTAFGRVWQARLVIALCLVLLPFWRGRKPPWLVPALAGLFLASLGLVGHAAMRSGVHGLYDRANQALHLLAGGFWLGALPPLLLCLRGLHDKALKAEATIALERFSGVGHVAVAAVLATGFVNVSMILGQWPTDFSSPYQTYLAAKILTVAAMVMLALYNRYRLVPRLALDPNAALALKRNTVTEIVLGGAVLVLVSAFATFEPI